MYATMKITYFSICLFSEVWICSSKLAVFTSSPALTCGALSTFSFYLGVNPVAQAGILWSPQ